MKIKNVTDCGCFIMFLISPILLNTLVKQVKISSHCAPVDLKKAHLPCESEPFVLCYIVFLSAGIFVPSYPGQI